MHKRLSKVFSVSVAMLAVIGLSSAILTRLTDTGNEWPPAVVIFALVGLFSIVVTIMVKATSSAPVVTEDES